MEKQIKNQKSKIKNWVELDQAMIDFSYVAARLNLQQDGLEQALAVTREAYARDIGPLVETRDALEAAMKEFAAANKSEFNPSPDGDGRSYAHAGVEVGFRKHPDTVKVPHRTADQEAALEYLRIYRQEFVRLAPEFDKPAILKALADGDAALVQALADHGISLKPGRDEFFCKVAAESEC